MGGEGDRGVVVYAGLGWVEAPAHDLCLNLPIMDCECVLCACVLQKGGRNVNGPALTCSTKRCCVCVHARTCDVGSSPQAERSRASLEPGLGFQVFRFGCRVSGLTSSQEENSRASPDPGNRTTKRERLCRESRLLLPLPSRLMMPLPPPMISPLPPSPVPFPSPASCACASSESAHCVRARGSLRARSLPPTWSASLPCLTPPPPSPTCPRRLRPSPAAWSFLALTPSH